MHVKNETLYLELSKELDLLVASGAYAKADLTTLKKAFCPVLVEGRKLKSNDDIVIKYETNCAERTCVVKAAMMTYGMETISIVDLDVNEEMDSMSNANCIEMTNIILVMGRLQVRWEDESV